MKIYSILCCAKLIFVTVSSVAIMPTVLYIIFLKVLKIKLAKPLSRFMHECLVNFRI